MNTRSLYLYIIVHQLWLAMGQVHYVTMFLMVVSGYCDASLRCPCILNLQVRIFIGTFSKNAETGNELFCLYHNFKICRNLQLHGKILCLCNWYLITYKLMTEGNSTIPCSMLTFWLPPVDWLRSIPGYKLLLRLPVCLSICFSPLDLKSVKEK